MPTLTGTFFSRAWPAAALFASAAMLAAAHAFETFGGYDPCVLCLRQREVYWAAIAVALVAIGVAALLKREELRRGVTFLLALVFLTGAIVAAYHAGAEWKFWPGPGTCAAGGLGGMTATDILDALSKPGKAPSCDEAAWRLFGLSMAGYNALISLALAGLSFAAAFMRPPQTEDDNA